jgi:hypothetical protein
MASRFLSARLRIQSNIATAHFSESDPSFRDRRSPRIRPSAIHRLNVSFIPSLIVPIEGCANAEVFIGGLVSHVGLSLTSSVFRSAGLTAFSLWESRLDLRSTIRSRHFFYRTSGPSFWSRTASSRLARGTHCFPSPSDLSVVRLCCFFSAAPPFRRFFRAYLRPDPTAATLLFPLRCLALVHLRVVLHLCS